jgi:fatty acid desaturase
VFGTSHDGEYLPLASGSPWGIVAFLSQCLWVGPLVIVRFLILAPLSWCLPPLRRLLYERASSLVINPHYLRPAPTPARLHIIRLQETLCCLICWGVVLVPPLFLHRWPIGFVAQAYLASVVVVFLNSLRTLAAHRYVGDGRQATLLGHLLDSVNVDDRSLLGCILNPVGLRYHALHHLFPTIPYHNLPEAHRRLMVELPADSPYRETVEPSVSAAIAVLWRRASEHSWRQARETATGGRRQPVDLEPVTNATPTRG